MDRTKNNVSKLMAILLVFLMAAGFMSLPASAAGTDTGSTASVEFEEGDVVIIPTDPGTTANPAGYENIGAINMKFKKTKIDGLQQVIESDGDKPVGLLVNDASGQFTTTWTTTVKISQFISTSDPTVSLDGFKIDMAPVAASITGPTVGKEPSASTVSIAADSTKPDGFGEAKEIFKSNVIGSPGIWGGNWKPTLTIAAGTAQVMLYESNVTWTLAVTP